MDVAMPGPLRPNDLDALRATLRGLKSTTDLPVLFGGAVHDSDVVLSGFVGTRGRALRNLVIAARRGLGGRVIVEQRPGAVADYFNSPHITHHYDRQVAGEGIESLMAAPVVVRGRTRAAIYGGLRVNRPIGDVVVEKVVRAAAELGREIEIRDEVDRRVALIENTRDAQGTGTVPAAVSEALTESLVALRAIAANTTDPEIVAQLQRVEETLARARGGSDAAPRTRLTGRERDVLSHAALGCRNAEIADRLSLSVETVKTYMRNVMDKLDVHSRHEAVVEARRQGLLP
ncbi:response regulator transcription factor [Rhodococcus sp. Z13]|uniref:Response regulator transcription factor n=1 Tax=Rhodococcus sacchari TaxID=2962047 RepID=A0ACD4DF23_9NOCA|nr:response regulator transcription factor [Rhodococcus sp. Z13]UYP18638.1 response regulator transcription factor [Rhodococcus sp. Z13]